MAFSILPRDDSFFDLFDQLSAKALEAARALEETFVRWDRLEERTRMIKDLEHTCHEINRLENESDDVLRLALRRLFAQKNDVLEVIKLKEIYEKLETAVDRCEDVANVIQTVVLRHA